MPYNFRKNDIPKLDLETDRNNFTSWIEKWTAYAALSGLNEENATTQYNVLRLALSRETANVVANLGLTEEDKQNVPKIIDALKKHVAGSVNETVERKSFRMRKQHMHESFDDYVIALRDLVKTCNYCNDECINKGLRDQIIEGLRDGDTVEELLQQKQLTIETTLRIGRAHESARQQREEIKSNPMNSAINATHTNKTKQ